MKKKKCGVCKFPKLRSEFYKNKTNSDGLDWRCKVCSAAYKAKFYLENTERVLTQNKRRYKSNMQVSLLKAAKMRAERYGLDFDISLEDVIMPTHCPILGLELAVSEGKRNENSPSLDRIENHKGYVKGNVCVISWRANRLKGDGTRMEHEHIAAWMEEHEHSTD